MPPRSSNRSEKQRPLVAALIQARRTCRGSIYAGRGRAKKDDKVENDRPGRSKSRHVYLGGQCAPGGDGGTIILVRRSCELSTHGARCVPTGHEHDRPLWPEAVISPPGTQHHRIVSGLSNHSNRGNPPNRGIRNAARLPIGLLLWFQASTPITQ